jgi:hypothetical protein
MLLASSWLLFEALRRARAPAGAGYALGLALVVLQAWRGPLDSSWLHGAFTNQPQLVLRQGPLDGPVTTAPELYRELAASPEDLTVVEYPTPAYALLMLRKYELFHGQRVLVGLDASDDAGFTAAPYVSIRDPAELRARADWFILHLDIREEVQVWREASGLPRGRYNAVDLEDALPQLIERLGEPAYRDERVVAWRFARR